VSGDGIGCFNTLLMSADPTTALESQNICVCICISGSHSEITAAE